MPNSQDNPLNAELDRLRRIVGEQVEKIWDLNDEINKLTLPQANRSPYEDCGALIGALVAEKQAAYGDSFGKAGDVLRLLYPAGVRPEQYDDALAITRIIDKLFRIATDRDALGESPYRDIAGYGILGAMRAAT